MARTRIEGAAPTRLWSELHLVTRNRIVVSVVISQQQIPVKYVELRMPVIAVNISLPNWNFSDGQWIGTHINMDNITWRIPECD